MVRMHGAPIEGPATAAHDRTAYQNTFPDLETEVTDGFAAGDRAAVQFTVTGIYEPYRTAHGRHGSRGVGV